MNYDNIMYYNFRIKDNLIFSTLIKYLIINKFLFINFFNLLHAKT